MPGGQPLANQPIREASQLAAEMADMPGGMPMPGMPAAMPMPGMPSPMIGPGGVSQGGPQVQNAPPTAQPLQPDRERWPDSRATPDSPEDAEAGDRRFLESPWFAKLPPELRNAIRNNAQRRPPRGYEERLKRYFESMD